MSGGTRRREHFFDAQFLNLLGEVGSEDAISIPQEISRHPLKRERLSQLLDFESLTLRSGASRFGPVYLYLTPSVKSIAADSMTTHGPSSCGVMSL